MAWWHVHLLFTSSMPIIKAPRDGRGRVSFQSIQCPTFCSKFQVRCQRFPEGGLVHRLPIACCLFWTLISDLGMGCPR
jgi:hypothetical protein